MFCEVKPTSATGDRQKKELLVSLQLDQNCPTLHLSEKLAHANDGNRARTRPAAKEVVFLVLVDFGLLISVYLSLLHLRFRFSTVSPL